MKRRIIPPAVRAAVWDRDHGRCVICGTRLDPETWHAHHRRYRSRGGTDTTANLIAIDDKCHRDQVHLQPRNATQNGWSVSRWGPGPELVPVRYFDGVERMLVDEELEAAMRRHPAGGAR